MDDVLQATTRIAGATVARWRSLVDALPEELLARPPAAGEWSALECLRHLLTAERRILSVRLQHLLAGRAEIIPFDPEAPRDPEPERTAQELLEAFAAQRAETLKVFDRLVPADFQRSILHPEFGVRVTLAELLSLWAAHDLQHTVQAEEALMQAFIPHTSVWRDEFRDHDVDARPADDSAAARAAAQD